MEVRKAVNLACKKKCFQSGRSWADKNKICTAVNSCIDQLPLRCIEDWEYERIYYFLHYYDLLYDSLSDSTKINVIAYSNDPGRNIIHSKGLEIDGPALSILHRNDTEKLGHTFYMCRRSELTEILNERIKMTGLEHKCSGLEIFFNNPDQMETLAESIGKRDATIIYIDSPKLEINFDTIASIKEQLPNLDLFINIPIATDLLPNLRNAVINPAFINDRLRFMHFLGDKSFFTDEKVFNMAYEGDLDRVNEIYLEKYIQKLKLMGFEFFDQLKLKQYNLLYYATSSKERYEYWLDCLGIEPNGQYRFKFYTRAAKSFHSKALDKFSDVVNSNF